MRQRLYGLALFALALGVTAPLYAQHAAEEVIFEAQGGGEVYGDLYLTGDGTDRPLIIMFHQGGASGRAEYAPIIPRLQSEGYDLFVIDQRQGGDRFGGHNRTVAARGGTVGGYCDAYADLEAALAFVHDRKLAARPIVWGSSYSAGLVIQLAARHPGAVAGALAFSPAAPRACSPDQYAANVEVPLLAVRPQSEFEDASVAAQLARFAAQGHQTYVANPGIHAASMLVPERVGGDVEATWEVVLAFLKSLDTVAG